MNCFKVKKIEPDGYVTLSSTDENFERQIPLRSAKIMFESGSLYLVNPEKIYGSKD